MSSVSTATSASRVERRRHPGWRIAWRIAFTLLFGAWSLLLLAWLVLQWGIVPRVGQWKPQIEAHASAALGVPVHIGAIRVRSGGWMPLIELDDVVLAPHGVAAGDPVGLRLPRVSAALSARSLLGLELRFEQLHVDGAVLEVRRNAEGRWSVAGIELASATAPDESPALDWLLAQHEVVVRHGRVRWVDDLRAAAPLELTDVDIVVRNRLARHDLRLDATPPADTGERFTVMGRFSQPLLATRSDWRRWSGQAYALLPLADAAALHAAVPALAMLPLQVLDGRGSLRAWLELRDGQARAARMDVALRDAALRFPGHVDALPLERLQGRLNAERDGRQLRLAADGLSFASGSIDWPVTQLSLALREAEPAPSAAATAPVFDGGDFAIDRVDLASLARLAAQLPLGTAVEKLLAELAPSGQVRDLSARWEGALDAPRRYQIKAQAQGLSIAAAASSQPQGIGRPGWRNANIDLDANEAGGRARLVLDKGALIFPGVFEQPEIEFDTFSSRLAWRITPQTGLPPALEVSLVDTRFSNPDVQGELATAQWHSGPGSGFARGARFPGQIELAGQLSRGRAAAVARYLPLGVVESARRYVEQAVTDGRVTQATFKVRGDLWDFPFAPRSAAAGASPPGPRPAPPSGEFRIVGRVEDVTVAYVPGPRDGTPDWPVFTRVAGELVFDRNAMELRNLQARLWGVELSKINASIRELEHPVLRIEGQGRGPLADLLRYVNASPVGAWTGQALREATATGPADLKLALELPLGEIERSTVQGSVLLPGNDVRIAPGTPLLAAAKARLAFTHRSFSIAGGSARVIGGDATFDGGTQPDGSLRFTGQGVASADGLRRATELGAVARLATYATGQAPYRVSLGVVRGRSEFAITSPLTGLALDLPAPLKKSAEAALPARFESRLAPDGAARDLLRVELGSVVSAQFQRDLSRDGAPAVLRGSIGVLEPAPPMPERGVQAVLALGTLDADAWQSTLDRVQGGSAAEAATGDDGYLPRTVALRAQAVISGGRRLTNLVAGVSLDPADGTWRGNLDADQLGGYVEYRASQGTVPGRVYARLARMALPEAQASSVETLLAEAPAAVPALDILIDNFELRGKKLGRVEVEAVNNRATREWRLTRLALVNPEAQLSGSGHWQSGAGQQRMVMDFKLDLADSGAFLDRLGFPGTLRGGKGRIAGQLSWAGSPLAFHVPSLDGKLNLALDAGQFLKAGPGAGRLLSVLSLQALPRRLVLDFRDLFQEGFAFDNITGDVTVDDGVAATRNLRMRGVQAAVLMEGSADLNRETQSLRVIVVPEINAGTASLAYAAINPAVGLGTFLAQLFLRRPLMAASTREFSVQGSWADPKVERVERKPGEPLPEMDAPVAPAAASAPKAAS